MQPFWWRPARSAPSSTTSSRTHLVTTDGTTQRPAAKPHVGRHRRRTRRPTRPVTLLLALVFFFGPLVAFALGARPQQIENRPLTDLPTASDGWDFFPAFT